MGYERIIDECRMVMKGCKVCIRLMRQGRACEIRERS